MSQKTKIISEEWTSILDKTTSNYLHGEGVGPGFGTGTGLGEGEDPYKYIN